MTTKVFDTFDGVAGTDIDLHTPNIDVVGGGWTDTGANHVELDGSGAIEFSGQGKSLWIDTGTTDQWSVINFNAGGSDNRISIQLRRDSAVHNSRTCYRFNLRFDNTARIYKVISGSSTQLSSTANSISTSTTYSLESEVDGSSLDFIIDGLSHSSVTDSSITTGSYSGVAHDLYTDNNARIYDFQIDDAAPVSGVTIPLGSHSLLGAGI